MELLLIFIGGALGALLRYVVYTKVNYIGLSYMPTFLVNMLGCFVIGFSSYLFGRRKDNLNIRLKSMMTIGFAGGLTTFSTFAFDLYNFIHSANIFGFVLYLFSSVLLGLCLVSVGINCAYSFMVSIIRARKGRNI